MKLAKTLTATFFVVATYAVFTRRIGTDEEHNVDCVLTTIRMRSITRLVVLVTKTKTKSVF